MSFPIRCWEVPAKAKMGTPVLKLVSCFLQVLDSGILRDNLGNLLANCWSAIETNLVCQIWTHPLCQFRKHFPLRTRFTNPGARNFWAKNDPSFGASFCCPPWHFVARRCR